MYYFDNLNASEPDREISDKIAQRSEKIWAGLSLTHSYSQQSTAIQEEIRFNTAQKLKNKPENLIFLSGIKEAIDFSLFTYKPQRIVSVGYCSESEQNFLLLKSTQLEIEYQHFSINFEKEEVLAFLGDKTNTLFYAHHFSLSDFRFFPVKQATKILHRQNSKLFLNLSETIGKLKIAINHIPADYIFASGNLINCPKHSAIGIFEDKELLKKLRAFENQELYLNLFFYQALQKAQKKPQIQFLSTLKEELERLNIPAIQIFFNQQLPCYLKIQLPLINSFRHQSMAVKFDLAHIAAGFETNEKEGKFIIFFSQLATVEEPRILIEKITNLLKWYTK